MSNNKSVFECKFPGMFVVVAKAVCSKKIFLLLRKLLVVGSTESL